MISLDNLLQLAKNRAASDLLVMVGDTPAMRVAGGWIRYDHPKCTTEDLEGAIKGLLRPEAWEELVQKPRSRFLRHLRQERAASAAMPTFSATISRWSCGSCGLPFPIPRQLGIPSHVIGSGDLPHGLVLISGPTGSGKSTTLAAIVEHINKIRHAHVITIEDPIEFIYTNAKSIIEQREIGSDTPSWHAALRTVLRQAPDVIVLGELRDLESISIALGAAETGHLVLASVHSSTAAGAVSRITDVFPPAQAPQIRLQLSQTLRMIFAQRLVPGRMPETRTLVYEILVNTPAIANLVRAGELEQIPNAISAGRDHGMISFLQCQRELAARGLLGTAAGRGSGTGRPNAPDPLCTGQSRCNFVIPYVFLTDRGHDDTDRSYDQQPQ